MQDTVATDGKSFTWVAQRNPTRAVLIPRIIVHCNDSTHDLDHEIDHDMDHDIERDIDHDIDHKMDHNIDLDMDHHIDHDFDNHMDHCM